VQPTKADTLQSFIEDRLEFAPDVDCSWNDLKGAFRNFAEEKRQKLNGQIFGALTVELRRRGCVRIVVVEEKIWKGVRLKK